MNKAICRNEIKRSLCNRWMAIAVIISAAFGIAGFLYTLNGKIEYNETLVQMGKTDLQYITNDTAYTKWMFFDGANVVKYIYLYIMPLLVVMPYSTSYYSDCRSGYVKQIITRCSAKSYYRAKYIANFISAGLVFVIPAVINFVMTSWIYPMHTPSPFVANLYGSMLFYDLYYDAPYIYVIGCLVYYFIVSGLVASISLLVSKYIENYFSIIITPFIIFFVNTQIDAYFNEGWFSIAGNINGKVMENFYVTLIMWALISVTTYFLFVHHRKKGVQ